MKIIYLTISLLGRYLGINLEGFFDCFDRKYYLKCGCHFINLIDDVTVGALEYVVDSRPYQKCRARVNSLDILNRMGNSEIWHTCCLRLSPLGRKLRNLTSEKKFFQKNWEIIWFEIPEAKTVPHTSREKDTKSCVSTSYFKRFAILGILKGYAVMFLYEMAKYLPYLLQSFL